MLVVARALMTNPLLLILDEATEGLAPVIRDEIWRVLELLKGEGQSILLIDKNLSALKRLADRHYILEKGQVVWSGVNADLDRDRDRVLKYIGVPRTLKPNGPGPTAVATVRPVIRNPETGGRAVRNGLQPAGSWP